MVAVVTVLSAGAGAGLARSIGASLAAAETRAERATWVRFRAAARRIVEEIELHPWARGGEAVRRVPGGLEVANTGVSPKLLRIVEVREGGSTAAEIRVDGRTAARLSGIDSVGIAPWRARDGALLGIRLTVDDGSARRRVLRLRFGTPGGTL